LDDGRDDWLTHIMKHDSMLNSIISHCPRVSHLQREVQETSSEMQAQVFSCLPCMRLIKFTRPRFGLLVVINNNFFQPACHVVHSFLTPWHHSRSSPVFSTSHLLTCYMLTAAQCLSQKLMSPPQGALAERRTSRCHSTHVKVVNTYLRMHSPVLLSWVCSGPRQTLEISTQATSSQSGIVLSVDQVQTLHFQGRLHIIPNTAALSLHVREPQIIVQGSPRFQVPGRHQVFHHQASTSSKLHNQTCITTVLIKSQVLFCRIRPPTT